MILLLALGGFVGCSGEGSRPERVPVSGTILYRGQPVEGAKVIFGADGDTPPAIGITGSDGRFSLTTYDPGDGAVPGNYTVTVTKNVLVGAAPPVGESMEAALERSKKEKDMPPTSGSALPDRYADPSQSGLKYTVEKGKTNDFEIVLKD